MKKKQVLEYRVYELQPQFPVLLLDGDAWRISPQKSGRLHFHNCLEFGFCHSGSGQIQIGRETFPFSSGTVTFMPQHLPHTTWSNEGDTSLWSYLFVDLRGLLFQTIANDEDYEFIHSQFKPDQSIITASKNPKAHFLTNNILDEMRAQRDNHDLVIRSLFLTLFCVLKRHFSNQPNHPSASQNVPGSGLALAPAFQYLYTNYMTPIRIEELAERCHMSQTHFRRLFLAIIGVSPLQFINALRVDRAGLLLTSTSETILEIAQSVGFASLSSFNRHFIKQKGMTPRDFRNMNQKLETGNKDQTRVLKYTGWTQADP